MFAFDNQVYFLHNFGITALNRVLIVLRTVHAAIIYLLSSHLHHVGLLTCRVTYSYL